MFKRFTDTDKWDDPWFSKLSPEYRSVWQYLCDKCDNSGMYKVNTPLLEFQTNIKIEKDVFFQAINKGKPRLLDLGDYWLVTGFVKFQFGDLGANSNLHNSVRSLMASHGLELIDGIMMASRCHLVKVKVKEQVKVSNKREISNFAKDRFEEFWEQYPNKTGKIKAYERFMRSVKTDGDLQQFREALARYSKHLQVNTWKHAQDGKTWFNSWQDWVDFKEPERRETDAERDARIIAKISSK